MMILMIIVFSMATLSCSKQSKNPLGPGNDTNIYNSITFVTIPSGTFRMGNIQGGGASDEKPVHSTTLSSFEMSVHEITQGQYNSVTGSNPSKDYGVGDNYPVYDVSWLDAIMFCNGLSAIAGLDKCYNATTYACDFGKNGFRLPTEAEWEYACRAGTETYFNTGNNLSGDGKTSTELALAGWYYSNSSSNTHIVGGKKANAFGLFDMHGNVWEWCNDWYGSYSSSGVTNPTGPSAGSYRVLRGGGWSYIAASCGSAYRYKYHPTIAFIRLGFRVVRRP